MIDREHKLSVARQAKLLGFSRGSVYYLPRPVSDGDLFLMRRIDGLHLDYPFAGSRMLQGLLRGEAPETGRLHVATLMRKMGIEAIDPRPNASKPAPGHKIYPYRDRRSGLRPPEGLIRAPRWQTFAPPRGRFLLRRVAGFCSAVDNLLKRELIRRRVYTSDASSR